MIYKVASLGKGIHTETEVLVHLDFDTSVGSVMEFSCDSDRSGCGKENM